MEFNDAVNIGRELLLTSLLLIAPVVGVCLVVGLLVSLLQTVTSIQEQTLSFAPKIVAVVAVLIVGLPWYLTKLQAYTIGMIEYITEVVR